MIKAIAVVLTLVVGLWLYLLGVEIGGELDGQNDVSAKVYGWSEAKRRRVRLVSWLYPLPFLVGMSAVAIGLMFADF